MARLSEAQVLESSPWEEDVFWHPPRGDDKWLFTADGKWIYRSHPKLRKRSFHPVHRSFPLRDVQRLTGQRVSVMFAECNCRSQGQLSKERMIFIDKFTETSEQFWKENPRWKGFTFFRIQGSMETKSSNANPVVEVFADAKYGMATAESCSRDLERLD